MAASHSLSAVALDILVPYWGDPDLMRETVESVFAQERDDWHLLVVDDAYPDPQISEWLTALDDPRVTVVRHDANVGITANYRECLARATQEHVVFLGCDDVLLPDYVGVVLDAFAAVPEAVMVQPGVRVVDETGTPSAGLADTVKQRLLRPRGAARTVLSGEPPRHLAAARQLALLAVDRVPAQRRSRRSGSGSSCRSSRTSPSSSTSSRTAGRWSSTRRCASSTAGTPERVVDDAGRRLAVRRRARLLRDGGRADAGPRLDARAERAARARLTSRAHAVSLLPGVVVRRPVVRRSRRLVRHAVTRG